MGKGFTLLSSKTGHIRLGYKDTFRYVCMPTSPHSVKNFSGTFRNGNQNEGGQV